MTARTKRWLSSRRNFFVRRLVVSLSLSVVLHGLNKIQKEEPLMKTVSPTEVSMPGRILQKKEPTRSAMLPNEESLFNAIWQWNNFESTHEDHEALNGLSTETVSETYQQCSSDGNKDASHEGCLLSDQENAQEVKIMWLLPSCALVTPALAVLKW